MGRWEDLEGVGERERGIVRREIIIKIHCMKKIIVNKISSPFQENNHRICV